MNGLKKSSEIAQGKQVGCWYEGMMQCSLVLSSTHSIEIMKNNTLQGKEWDFHSSFPKCWSSYYQSKPNYYSLPYELQLFFQSLFDIIAKACTWTSWWCTFKHNKLLIFCCSTSPGLFVISLFSLSIYLNFIFEFISFLTMSLEDNIEQNSTLTENSLLRQALQKNKCLHIVECHLVTPWYLLALTPLNLTTYTCSVGLSAR